MDDLKEAAELFNKQKHTKYKASCLGLQAKFMITVNDDLFNSEQDLYVARTLIDEASALVTKIRDESIIKDIKEIKNKIFD